MGLARSCHTHDCAKQDYSDLNLRFPIDYENEVRKIASNTSWSRHMCMP